MWSGSLGRAYKEINPDVTYVGVELVDEPAKEAAKHLDIVIHQDVEQATNLNLPDEAQRFDCIIFGDVLEHLINPLSVLTKLSKLLNDDGIVLACIPNIQHWTAIASLLEGYWPEEESGLFDRTHVRWFTRKSILKLFNDAGLKIFSITPRIFNAQKAMEFVEKLQPSLQNLGIDSTKLLQECAPLQYVIQTAANEQPLIDLRGCMLKKQAGMTEVRMIQPLRSVASLGNVRLNLESNTYKLSDDIQENMAKIAIWQRQMLRVKDSISTIRWALSKGYILISEFDDDPDHWPEIADNQYLAFQGVHAVQTSTRALEAKIRKLNPEVESLITALSDFPLHAQ